MKKVLVLGATGAMGRYIVPELVKLNYEVVGVGLEESAPWKLNARYVKGNAFDKEFLTELLKEKFDGIVNFMCYGKYSFSDYYKLFLDNTDHYIFLSSCRIYDDKEDYLKILSPEMSLGTRWQLEYARLFRRITDNSKVLALTGLRQEDMMPMYDGLKLEIGNIPKDYVPADTPVSIRMDEYIKEHNL